MCDLGLGFYPLEMFQIRGNMRNVKEREYGGEGGILPLVRQEIPVMMIKPNFRVRNGTEVL